MGEQGDGPKQDDLETVVEKKVEQEVGSSTPEQQQMNEAADLLIDVVRRCDDAGDMESCLHKDDKENVFRFAKGLKGEVPEKSFTIEAARQQMNRILEAMNRRAMFLNQYNGGDLPTEVRRQMLMVGDAAAKIGLTTSR